MKRNLILVISLVLAITFLVVVQFGNDVNWTDKGAVQKTASFDQPTTVDWVQAGSVGPGKSNSSDTEVEEEVEEEYLISFDQPTTVDWVQAGPVSPVKTNSSDTEVEEEVEEESLNFKDYGILTEAQYPYT